MEFKRKLAIPMEVKEMYPVTAAIGRIKEVRDAEIRGIADGSGFELSEILALNVRSEIVLQGSQVNDRLDGGCTSCAFMPYKTAAGDVLLAQNWDWKAIAKGALIVLEIHQAGKPDILMITEAGIVGKIGFNSAGIGVCLNALGSDKRWDGETIPLHIALRGVLNSHTLADAIENAGRVPLACCANFMMAGASGQVITVEIGPGEIDVIYPDERGYVTHTNHFYGPRTAHIRDTGRMAFPDTYLRLGRIADLLRDRDVLAKAGEIAAVIMHDDPAQISDAYSVLKARLSAYLSKESINLIL